MGPRAISLRAATHRPGKSFRVEVLVCMNVTATSQGCDLVNTLSSMRIFTNASATRLPLRRRKPAHVALLLAWLAFWLNTAFLPCCEAFAVAFAGHADGVSQSVPAAAHHADATHTAPDSHEPHCSPDLNTQTAINGEHAGLPRTHTDLADLELVAGSVLFSIGPAALSLSLNLALRDYHPPPHLASTRVYLHTQRLLI